MLHYRYIGASHEKKFVTLKEMGMLLANRKTLLEIIEQLMDYRGPCFLVVRFRLFPPPPLPTVSSTGDPEKRDNLLK
jgi:hypothetical protein